MAKNNARERLIPITEYTMEAFSDPSLVAGMRGKDLLINHENMN